VATAGAVVVATWATGAVVAGAGTVVAVLLEQAVITIITNGNTKPKLSSFSFFFIVRESPFKDPDTKIPQ
jgi:hypothetical protein